MGDETREPDVCPRCDRTIQPGEEIHPTPRPFHLRCSIHGRCYVLCDHDG